MASSRRISVTTAALLTAIGFVTAMIVSAGASAATRSSAHAQIDSRENYAPVGRVLTVARGRVLYLFTRDSASDSACTGSCRSAWIGVTSAGAPTAGPQVSASKLARTSSGQVTYNGHPLYRYTGDHKPGQTRGEGAHTFGGHWYLVTTSGHALKPVDCSAPGSLCGDA
jgi:predicted lipoprotein with Yx(FWY)xxD motif